MVTVTWDSVFGSQTLCEIKNASFLALWGSGVNLLQVIYLHVTWLWSDMLMSVFTDHIALLAGLFIKKQQRQLQFHK